MSTNKTRINTYATLHADWDAYHVSTFKGLLVEYQDASGATQEERFYRLPRHPDLEIAYIRDLDTAEARAAELDLTLLYASTVDLYTMNITPECIAKTAMEADGEL